MKTFSSVFWESRFSIAWNVNQDLIWILKIIKFFVCLFLLYSLVNNIWLGHMVNSPKQCLQHIYIYIYIIVVIPTFLSLPEHHKEN